MTLHEVGAPRARARTWPPPSPARPHRASSLLTALVLISTVREQLDDVLDAAPDRLDRADPSRSSPDPCAGRWLSRKVLYVCGESTCIASRKSRILGAHLLDLLVSRQGEHRRHAHQRLQKVDREEVTQPRPRGRRSLIERMRDQMKMYLH